MKDDLRNIANDEEYLQKLRPMLQAIPEEEIARRLKEQGDEMKNAYKPPESDTA
jgi:hypothetical protein